MAGYVSPSNTKTAGLTYNALLYCKTNIGGYFFDGFMSVSHNIETQITENPVETGAAIVDHAYVKPAVVTMKIAMSDVHDSFVKGQFSGGWSRSTTAWNILKKLQSDRIPMSIFTRLGQYNNMIIKSLSASDDSDTIYSLNADVVLQQIPVARVRTLKISAAPQVTEQTDLGKEEVTTIEQSSLYIKYGNSADRILSFFGVPLGTR